MHRQTKPTKPKTTKPKTTKLKTKKISKAQLFSDAKNGRPRVKGTGYGSKSKALKTLKLIKNKPIPLQKQIAITMYYRAKHHKFQTQGMKNAIRVYKPFLKKLKIKTRRGGSKNSRPEWLHRTKPAYSELWESRTYPLEADRL